VRIRISAQKQNLKEQKANHPNARRTAKPGKNILSEKQLNLKEQKGAGKNCQADQLVVRDGCVFSELIWICRLASYLADNWHCIFELFRHAE
jgi:hypothetical protein